MSERTPRDPRTTLVAAAIADALGETEPYARRLVWRVVRYIGVEQAQTLLEEAQQLEAAGGMMTLDNSRRRTIGGVFFRLAGDRIPPRDRWHVLRPQTPRTVAGAGEPGAAAAPALTWADRVEAAREAAREKGLASMKIVLVGRPGRIVTRGGCMITVLAGRPAPSFPKGLPLPPPPPTDCTVYIAAKQWESKGIAQALADPEDRLIVEGWCAYDPELEGLAVYATNVDTKHLQAARNRAKAGSKPAEGA